jgi:hypothetical protein
MQTTDAAGLPAIHTRAKFYISGLELLPGQSGVKATLQAVARGDRNADWASATPCGSITMTINNPAAAAQWERFMQESRATGKQPEVFVDFAPASDGWAGDGHLFRPGEGEPGTCYGPDNCGECGQTVDADLFSYDREAGKSVAVGQVHPNG